MSAFPFRLPFLNFHLTRTARPLLLLSLGVGLGLGVSATTTSPLLHFHRHTSRPLTLHADSPATRNPSGGGSVLGASSTSAVLRQASLGSILGLFGGVAVGVFSKPLALLLGVLMLGVQALESRGIHVIPYAWLQRNVKDVDVKGLLRDNIAFKAAFGATFTLAAFAGFD